MIIRAVTIEQRLFAKKKRKRVLQHKQGTRKILTIVLPAQEAVGGQPLAPILGQVQILVSDFVDQFNDKSKLYPSGFPLNVEICVDWDKSYYFSFRPIPFTHFVYDFIFILPIFIKRNDLKSDDFVSCIYINDLFKLFLLFKTYYNFKHIPDLQIFNLMKHLMLNLNINISMISRQEFISSITDIFQNDDMHLNLYHFIISELHMNSYSGINRSMDSKSLKNVDIISNIKLDKKKYKRKNKKKYVI